MYQGFCPDPGKSSQMIAFMTLKAQHTQDIFAHNTYCDKYDNFEPWMSKGQGKLLTKRQIKVHKSRYILNRAYLNWSLKPVAHNYLFIFLSHCCVQKYLMCIRPMNTTFLGLQQLGHLKKISSCPQNQTVMKNYELVKIGDTLNIIRPLLSLLGLNFNNIFMYSFYARSSQKRKNSVKLSVTFYAFRSCVRKSCTQNVDEIEPRSSYVEAQQL